MKTSEECKLKTIQHLKKLGRVSATKPIMKQILDDIDTMGFDNALEKSKKAAILRQARSYADDVLAHQKTLALERETIRNGHNEKLVSRGLNSDNRAKSLHEYFVQVSAGLAKTGKDAKVSMGRMMDTLIGEHFSTLRQALGEHIEFAGKEMNQKSIYEALDKLNKGEQVAEGPLREVARAIQLFNKYIVQTLKHSGIEINERADYIARQIHSPTKMMKGGEEAFDNWKIQVKKNIDPIKTFGARTEEEIDVMLKDIYFDIIDKGYSSQGSSTLGKARTLHFKDGANLYEYHSKYGEGNIVEVMQKTAEAAARGQARNKFFGNSPVDMWDSMERKAVKILKDANDVKGLEEFQSGMMARERLRLKEQFVSGLKGVAGQGIVAKSINNLVQYQAVTKLSSSFFSTFVDSAIHTANFMAKTGKNPFESFIKGSMIWLKNIPAIVQKDEKFINKAASLYKMAMDHDTMRFDSPDTGIAGGFKKVTNAALKANFLDFSTRNNRANAAMHWGSFLADETVKTFDELNPKTRAEMEAFGITAADWDDVRKAEKDLYDGVEYLAPGNASTIDVRRKFNSLIQHNARFGAITPDGYMKAMLTFGMDPNSAQAASMKMVMQFKSYSLQLMRSVAEILKSNPNADNDTLLKAMQNKDNAAVFGTLMVMGWGASYTGSAIKNALMGREYEFNKDNIAEAVKNGVAPFGMTYLMDMMRGEYKKYGRDFMADLAGPSASTINDIAKIISGAADGDNVTAATSRLIRRNTPMANAPLISPLLDKMFYNEWMEAASPGYKMRKYQQQLEAGRESFIGL